mmetsp:Transcript_10761/g.26120  ORF Transcript_10761/g.26120 Transcript_10761/m.26120 type:complete len:457 (+) Transcript_10761:323-1693(+)
MLWRHDHVRGAEQGVGPRREHRQLGGGLGGGRAPGPVARALLGRRHLALALPNNRSPHGTLRVGRARKLHEPEPPGAARLLVRDDRGAGDRAVLGHGLLEAIGVECKGYPPDVALAALHLNGLGRGPRAPVHDLEVDLGALGLADPVALHLLDALGPVDKIEVLKEPVGVGRDLEHPLLQVLAVHGVVTALAEPVDHLLVGEDGPEGGAPVDGDLGLVRETLFKELEEDPLGPLVVLLVSSRHLPLPVVREAQRLELLPEAVDVLLGGHGGVRAGLDGVLLGGEAKGVPAHWVHHVVAFHLLVPRHDVCGRVPLRVSDVQAGSGRVREHVQGVEFGLGHVAVGVGAERLPLFPRGLPLLLELGERVPSALSRRGIRRCLLNGTAHHPQAVRAEPVAERRAGPEPGRGEPGGGGRGVEAGGAAKVGPGQGGCEGEGHAGHPPPDSRKRHCGCLREQR